jgi:hypothetical protein
VRKDWLERASDHCRMPGDHCPMSSPHSHASFIESSSLAVFQKTISQEAKMALCEALTKKVFHARVQVEVRKFKQKNTDRGAKNAIDTTHRGDLKVLSSKPAKASEFKGEKSDNKNTEATQQEAKLPDALKAPAEQTEQETASLEPEWTVVKSPKRRKRQKQQQQVNQQQEEQRGSMTPAIPSGTQARVVTTAKGRKSTESPVKKKRKSKPKSRATVDSYFT